jgi:hypothetical protein
MSDLVASAFNSDLLSHARDRQRAAKLFPGLLHVLDHPELRALFAEYDDPANKSKKRSLQLGVLAILLGGAALLGASAEIIIEDDHLKTAVAAVSAAFGLSGVVIGIFGVLHHRAKREWLQRRLMTERLRQFHFQTFVYRWTDIAKSLAGAAAVTEYEAKRATWFEVFKSNFQGHLHAQLSGLIAYPDDDDFTLHESITPPTGELPDNDAAFDAYFHLRILHQMRYADEKLDDSPSFIPKTSKAQQALFSNISLACILILFIIHLAIATLLPFEAFKMTSASVHDIIHVRWINFVAIWIAIIALAVRALEEGLRPDRETERYRYYGTAVRAIRDRFKQAASVAEKLDVMRDMERLAFDEMRNFLITNYEARFIL